MALRIGPETHFAHKGLHDARLPANSIAAAVAAAEAGYGVEIDLQLAADGVAVLLHDADTMNETGVELQIAEQPSALLKKEPACCSWISTRTGWPIRWRRCRLTSIPFAHLSRLAILGCAGDT